MVLGGRSLGPHLAPRGDCSTVTVASDDSCAKLASKCNIAPASVTVYNPSPTFCSSLMPGQHVCCSTGTLPDLAPKPNSDGSCVSHTVAAGDSCSSLAAAFSLTVDKLEGYNKNTWGWSGCNPLYAQAVICISSGSPPMPATVANAMCGPQVPGTKQPAGGTSNIAGLNPCPLNACCDIWGQCGTTREFCVDTSTGAPGSAAPNTNGCISNCGTDVVKSGAPKNFISLAYYEGYGMDRDCLYQDARQINTAKYTHVHFAFGVLDNNYAVTTGSAASTYEFNAFKALPNVKRVLSFGGWAFSTNPSTYNIFRTGVTAANRVAMATSIANFIKANNLDGVDIDWEYPGEPDIVGIPAGSAADGTNYLDFLVVLKNLLPGKTVSIAAPASYYYLKAFPIAQISKVVDYIIYMTYDLHGQWDANNKWSQEGCSTGMCLRSHVNLTETKDALAMITKAGVASNKLVVGITSYGRSFAMADANCYGPNCGFTGTATQSDAKKGPCTKVAGYISDAEINDIINKSPGRINQNYVDATSNSRVVVYDDTQWVAFMDDAIRAERTTVYKAFQLGGTTNWALDLESYNEAPDGSHSWPDFLMRIGVGGDPYELGNRTGNWSTLTCQDPAALYGDHLSASLQWAELDAANAWTDMVNQWKQYDSKTGISFTESIVDLIGGIQGTSCGQVDPGCVPEHCAYFTGGAAAYLVWNSLVKINELYVQYQTALVSAAALTIDPSLDSFEQTFAPVTPPPSAPWWLGIVISLVSMVGTMAMGGFFTAFIKDLPFFAEAANGYETAKTVATGLVGTGISALSAAGTSGAQKPPSSWTGASQAAFGVYMAEAMAAWSSSAAQQLVNLFDGSDGSITALGAAIANGALVAGNGGATANITKSSPYVSTLAGILAKGSFAFAIANIWPQAGTQAFVVDSGFACGTINPLGKYMTTDTMEKTFGCYNNKLYYLVYPKGDASFCDPNCGGLTCSSNCHDGMFVAPPGIDGLDGKAFGGVKVVDIISGAVSTYNQNGNANGGAPADPSDPGTLRGLVGGDITTPGFITLPVCSAEAAFTGWSTVKDSSTPYWPCVVAPSPDYCGASTFIDQTSDASPSVSDCMVVVNNIKGTDGQWTIQTIGKEQHQIAGHGGCNFGVQATELKGNVDFSVGAQDIVDIITESIKQFGGGGKVGAKGDMSCNGNIKGQGVEWGLY